MLNCINPISMGYLKKKKKRRWENEQMKVRLAFFIKVTAIIKGLCTVDAIFIAAFNRWIFKALFITPASIYLF